MALKGQLIWGPTGNGAYFSFEWTATQNKTARTSTVSWKLYGRGRSSSPTWIASNYYLSINGSEVSSFTDSWPSGGNSDFSFANAKKDSGNFTVYHDDNGSASFKAKIYAYISSSSFNWATVEETFDLDDIQSLNYTITYKPGTYATGDEYTGSANVGSKITLRGATYTRDNYTQTGWSTKSDGTTKDYDLSKEYALSDGTVLYPYWEYNYVTVSYDPNGGTGTVDSQSVLKGSNVTLQKNGFDAPPATSPVHAIYLKDETGNHDSNNGTATCYENKFYRWGLKSATGTSYKEGASYGPVNAPTVFYAKWSTNYQLGSATKSSAEKAGYQVIFDAITNGGTCSTVVLNSKIYTHYDFAGWISSSSGTVYQPGAKVGGATAYTYKESWTSRTENGSIDLPAAFKTDPSSTSTSITLNPNKGTCNIRSMQSTASITYTFAGWYNGNDRVGGAGDKFTPDKATTLVAQFTSQTSNFNSIILPTPTRSGYKFLGWSTDPNATAGIIGEYTPQGGETLYAIWRPNGTVRISYGPSKMETKAQIFIFKDGKWQMAQGWTFDNSWKINGG